jgi:hypothetical protein
MKNQSLFLCRSITSTPILNRKDFSYVFGGYGYGLLLDDRGLLKSLEMIAPVGSYFHVVSIHDDLGHLIYEITFEDYPSSYSLYIDSRFVEKVSKSFTREKKLPDLDLILQRLKKMISLPYIWGGNVSQGVPEMLDFYPPKRELTSHEKINWIMQGVDCSGMLYEAAEGFFPRNTSDLINLATPYKLIDQNISLLSRELNPLDLVVYKGHVIITLDKNHFIESRAHRGGVFLTEKEARLELLLKEEASEVFVLRMSSF